MLDTVESLRELNDKDFDKLGLPLGLVKQILKRLEETASNTFA